MSGGVVRVAAIGDLHCTKASAGTLQPLLGLIAEAAELLLIAGDLTDYGLAEEARVLARELTSLRIPVVAVLGNHDFESEKQDEVQRILVDAGVVVLDGDACEILGIGIAGVKGFGGGFGARALGPWGEPMTEEHLEVWTAAINQNQKQARLEGVVANGLIAGVRALRRRRPRAARSTIGAATDRARLRR